MDNFDHLKQLWQQQPVSARSTNVTVAELKKNNADNQRKLERPQLISAILLLLTAIIIIWMGFFSSIQFQSTLTYIAVVLLALIPAIQGFINLSVYSRLRRIDVTAPVAEHLAQWQQYYDFRKKLIRVNIPLYYVLLNVAFSLYFIEILGHFSLLGRITALSLYTAWVLFAYFVLGKRTLRKEDERLEMIIGNLRTIQQQLTDKI